MLVIEPLAFAMQSQAKSPGDPWWTITRFLRKQITRKRPATHRQLLRSLAGGLGPPLLMPLAHKLLSDFNQAYCFMDLPPSVRKPRAQVTKLCDAARHTFPHPCQWASEQKLEVELLTWSDSPP